MQKKAGKGKKEILQKIIESELDIDSELSETEPANGPERQDSTSTSSDSTNASSDSTSASSDSKVPVQIHQALLLKDQLMRGM